MSVWGCHNSVRISGNQRFAGRALTPLGCSCAIAGDCCDGDVVDLHRLLEQAVEEKAALARAAAVEGEGELVQVEVELLRADRSLVPSSQRLSSEETRCARGIATWAESPLAAMLVGWWTNPALVSPS